MFTLEPPGLYDLWQDPQERSDLFVRHWTEKTCMSGPIGQKAIGLLATTEEHPNRPIRPLSVSAAGSFRDDAVAAARVRTVIRGRSAGTWLWERDVKM